MAAYLNGHDHDLQLIQAPGDPVTYVVSGAGSDIRPGEFDGLPADQVVSAPFLADDQGFVAATLAGATLSLYFYVSQMPTPAYYVKIQQPSS